MKRITSTALALFELVLFLFRSRSANWWRTPPFLPLISCSYFRWRLQTAYGSTNPTWRQFARDSLEFGRWLHALRPFVKHGRTQTESEFQLDGDIKITKSII